MQIQNLINMNTITFVLGVLLSSSALAGGGQPIAEEVGQKLILDLSNVELNKENNDFVVVSFIVYDKQIAINDINGSNRELIKAVSAKLSSITLNDSYSEDDLYRLKFTFEEE
jgi:hypothetical protein